MPAHPIDIAGRRFGRLVAVKWIGRSRRGQRLWRCECDCGKMVEVGLSALRRGHTRSCGCLRNDKAAERFKARALPDGDAAFNSLLYDYRYNADKRGLIFSLTQEQFREIISSPCAYCGRPPANVYTKHNCNGSFIYSGVDRVDNSRGYLQDNCVPCCKFCNYAKKGGSVEEFQEWLKWLKEAA